MSRILVPFVRVLRGVQLLSLALLLASCGSTPSAPPSISLNDGKVEVSGLPSDTLRALEALSDDQWPDVFAVAVSSDAPGMLGAYRVDGSIVRFTPAFPLDAGRQYAVRFNAGTLPGAAGGPALTAMVGRPAERTEPTTEVLRIYPTGGAVPENVLRMYIEFSAPMGRKSGVEYLTLLDHNGKEIPGAVLPLDYEFWSPDHRRFTVFFDPGRVKDGILPNREMGRAFTPGKTVTLVVNRDWRDEHGLPLKAEHRRSFEVLPADTRPLSPADWRITPPPARGRMPLVVTFPTPLDQSLLMRALGVRQNGKVVEGETTLGAGETQWSFTPREPWTAGTYQFLALDILEDIAGNQVGRAFEVDNFDSVDKDPDPKQVLLPFQVK
ncbi:MAG: hypothetical protein ABL986_17060 [Vicinamibacterales bacterium]